MSVEKVRNYLKRFGMESRIIEFDTSSATVALAAEAIGCEPCRIAKSLSFKSGGKPILVVASGDARIDNRKYKSQFGEKAKMLTPDETLELIGHAVGGVCPFAVNNEVEVYLDCSLKRFEKIFPACGSSNSVIELTISELEKLSGTCKWVDVCKLPE